jgi:triphosphoribosyl-dephospho-CoA synthase
LTLREAMALGADRDLIARQYTNDFAEVWNDGISAISEGLRQTGSMEGAILFAQLTLLAKHPDSLIARKRGLSEAQDAGRRAAAVLDAGWPGPAGWKAYRDLDTWLRAEGRQRNPGTTADLLTACLFILLREDTIRLPLEFPWAIPWPAGFSS